MPKNAPQAILTKMQFKYIFLINMNIRFKTILLVISIHVIFCAAISNNLPGRIDNIKKTYSYFGGRRTQRCLAPSVRGAKHKTASIFLTGQKGADGLGIVVETGGMRADNLYQLFFELSEFSRIVFIHGEKIIELPDLMQRRLINLITRSTNQSIEDCFEFAFYMGGLYTRGNRYETVPAEGLMQGDIICFRTAPAANGIKALPHAMVYLGHGLCLHKKGLDGSLYISFLEDLIAAYIHVKDFEILKIASPDQYRQVLSGSA